MPSLEPLRQYEESVGRVRNSILELREMASGGRDLVRKHCQFLREDIEIAAESRIDEIRKLSAKMCDNVTAYEEQLLGKMDSQKPESPARYAECIRDAQV